MSVAGNPLKRRLKADEKEPLFAFLAFPDVKKLRKNAQDYARSDSIRP